MPEQSGRWKVLPHLRARTSLDGVFARMVFYINSISAVDFIEGEEGEAEESFPTLPRPQRKMPTVFGHLKLAVSAVAAVVVSLLFLRTFSVYRAVTLEFRRDGGTLLFHIVRLGPPSKRCDSDCLKYLCFPDVALCHLCEVSVQNVTPRRIKLEAD